MDLQKEREEFEKLDEIKALICDGDVYFDEISKEYVCIRQDDGGVEKALNLALQVFKRKHNGFIETNARINDLLKTVLWHKEDCELKLTSDECDQWAGGQLEILEIIKKELEEPAND